MGDRQFGNSQKTAFPLPVIGQAVTKGSISKPSSAPDSTFPTINVRFSETTMQDDFVICRKIQFQRLNNSSTFEVPMRHAFPKMTEVCQSTRTSI
jgi:hypothetical protein